MWLLLKTIFSDKLMFLFITFEQIELESCATAHITGNEISCPNLLYFLKINVDSSEISSEQVHVQNKPSFHCAPMVEWTYGRTNGRTDGCINRGMNGLLYKSKLKRTEGRTDWWTDLPSHRCSRSATACLQCWDCHFAAFSYSVTDERMTDQWTNMVSYSAVRMQLKGQRMS